MPTLEKNPVSSRVYGKTPTMSEHFRFGPLICECEGAIRNPDMVLIQDYILQIFPTKSSMTSSSAGWALDIFMVGCSLLLFDAMSR